ncbi:MAG TPA: zonular occludens toxin domain-containing protein [Rhodocyclaceae bacterium]|nr:zonular occludens toxin domain-containing protein [Rhodocyclaceae bacterium]
MPIKIHHGPPGSYKTAGAVADDFLREARAGRVIITNCRGVSRERTLEEFPDLPASFDVIHVDDKTEEGRKKWATWFHWAPHGAFILMDEVQDVWPKRWRESDLRVLDYPGGVEQATKDDRPKDWEQAFDKHRHWNWDMTLTTPNYAKVRDDIKGVADMAYKHKNLALVGWTGRYIEAAHLADDTGKAQSDFLNVQNKKVPKYVFKLYDSTQTGKFSDTKNGFNLLLHPRILLLLGVVAIALFFILRNGRPSVLGGSSVPVASHGPSVGVAPHPSSSPAAGSVPGPRPSLGGGSSNGQLVPFDGEGVFIVMSMKARGVWKYAVSYAGTTFTSEQLLDMGYTIRSGGSCGVTLSRNGWERFITCGVSNSPNPNGLGVAGAMAGGRPASPVSAPVLTPGPAV